MSRVAGRRWTTLTGLVSAAASHLSAELIDTAQLVMVKSVSSCFPAPLSRLIGFEFRLNGRGTPVDFMFQVRRATAGQCTMLLPELAARPDWRRLCAFFHQWAGLENSPFKQLRNVWLEFDLNPGNKDVLVPNIFFEVGLEFVRSARGAAFVSDIFSTLDGTEPNTPAEKTLRACLQRLPAQVDAVMFGVLLPRRTDVRRVCVQGISIEQLGSYLGAISWPGRLAEVRPTLDVVAPTVDHLTLDLDLVDEVLPRIGIEYMFRQRTRASVPSQWDRPLAALQRLGLARAGLHDSVQQFCGSDEYRPSDDFTGPITPGARPILWRRLNHIKTVHSPGKTIEAKCYLFARDMEGGQNHVTTRTG